MADTGANPEAPDTITLTGPGGLSLTIPDFYREVPHRESARTPLVAAVNPEADPREFTPTITVEVEASTPALATVAGLSVATVTRQIALGRHVVAVDVWPVEGQADGRRVESVYAEGDDTILQLQYLTVRGETCITLSVFVLASAHGLGLETFGYVAGTLHCEEPAAPVPPSPGPQTERGGFPGTSLEPLAGIRARQPFLSDGPRLEPDDLRALRANRRRSRLGRDALLAAGLVDGNGELTGAGRTARELLVKAKAQLIAQVTVPGTTGSYGLEALLGGSEVAVLADPPPGSGGERIGRGRTLDVIPALTLGVTLLSWLGLVPAWSSDPAAPPDRETTIPRAVWAARLADPRTVAPKGATASLERMWEQPWEVATVRTSKRWRNGPGSLQYVSTPDAGYVLVIPDAHDRWVRLESRPAAQVLHALFVVAGIVDRREPQ